MLDGNDWTKICGKITLECAIKKIKIEEFTAKMENFNCTDIILPKDDNMVIFP